MKVSGLGEFALIDLLAKTVFSPHRKLAIGIGDDASAWQSGAGVQLATIDSLFEGVHFLLGYTSWQELGWKALAVNLSDIAAMGGVPEYALVSLGLPPDTDVENVVEMYRGINGIAQKYGVAVAGGDTCRAPVVSVTIAVVGRAGDSGILRRSGARPGDVVAVTGYLGGAAAGLDMLRNGMHFSAGDADRLRRAFLRPEPRIAEGRLLADHGVKTAIDISDGLVADLVHICRQSGVGARIYTDRLPVHPSVKTCFPARAMELALGGGEDYELLFTAGRDVIEGIKAKSPCAIGEIGEIVAEHAGEVRLLAANGSTLDVRGRGWEHFRSDK